MQKIKQPTVHELKDRIAALESALRVARGCAHSVLHSDQGRADACNEAICGSITAILNTPIGTNKRRVEAADPDDDGVHHVAQDEMNGSLDLDAPTYANNKDWDTGEEEWASSSIGGRRTGEDKHEFWDRILQACELLDEGETKTFHLVRVKRGQNVNRMELRAKLMTFLRRNGGEDMRWKIDSDDDGGYRVRLGRGKHAGYAPVPDQPYYFVPNYGGGKSRLRHPDAM